MAALHPDARFGHCDEPGRVVETYRRARRRAIGIEVQASLALFVDLPRQPAVGLYLLACDPLAPKRRAPDRPEELGDVIVLRAYEPGGVGIGRVDHHEQRRAADLFKRERSEVVGEVRVVRQQALGGSEQVIGVGERVRDEPLRRGPNALRRLVSGFAFALVVLVHERHGTTVRSTSSWGAV